MGTRIRIVAVLAVALALAVIPAAAMASPAALVAGPGATAAGFLPPNVAITQGGSLSLSNVDTATHNVVCDQRDPVTLAPICSSPYANPQQTVSVAGVAALAPGTYGLHCQLHPQMTATLTIV